LSALTRPHHAPWALTVTLIVFAALSVVLLGAGVDSTFLRALVSVPTLLFSPGYMVLTTRFAHSLKRMELILLSVGLSLAITGIWAVILDEFELPVTPLVVGSPLIAITLILGGLRLWRLSRRY
jgi:uncharacterized membrane protein